MKKISKMKCEICRKGEADYQYYYTAKGFKNICENCKNKIRNNGRGWNLIKRTEEQEKYIKC